VGARERSMQGTAARGDEWACSSYATCGRQYCLQMPLALLKHATSAIARSHRPRRITRRRVAPDGSCRMLRSATALGKTRHGPLLRPADDLQPQILCILWLDARNGLGNHSRTASILIAQNRTRRNPPRWREACPGLRVTFISDKTYGPPRLLPYRNTYQRTACRANDVL
jgi:hypothetical protein